MARRRVFDPSAPSGTTGCPACGADLSWVKAMDLRVARFHCRCHRGIHPGINELRCRACKKLVIVKGTPGDLLGLSVSATSNAPVVTDAEFYEAYFKKLDRQ